MSLNESELIEKAKNAERADLVVALELAKFVHDELETFTENIREQVRVAINLNATTVKRIEGLEGAFSQLKGDLETTRRDRASQELKVAEARYNIAKEQKDQLSTAERLGKLADERIQADREKQTKRRQEIMDDVIRSAVKTAVNAVVAIIALAIFTGMIVFLARAFHITVVP